MIWTLKFTYLDIGKLKGSGVTESVSREIECKVRGGLIRRSYRDGIMELKGISYSDREFGSQLNLSEQDRGSMLV